MDKISMDQGCKTSEECKASKESHVNRSMSILNEIISVLDDLVSKLTNRLEIVLIPEEETKKDSKPEEYLVPLASAIRSLTLRVSDISNRCERILRDIEL